MSIFQEKLVSAIRSRESHKHEEARQLLLKLHAEFPNEAQVNYGSPVFAGKVLPAVPQGYFVIVLLAGGTICHEMLTHFKNRTAAISWGASRQLLENLNYQCAWIHDLLGLEREAILFYETAIQAGLNEDDLKRAWPGMRSAYQ